MLSSHQLALGAFSFGLAVGAGGAYVWVEKRRSAELQQQPGVPSTEALRINEGYVVAFDYRTRNPKWVLEHITEQSSSGGADRKHMDFFEDKTIEDWLRSKLSDYRGSGYDRGHMAPAADYKGSPTAMAETFSLCNISPQVGEGFNRDYWARFEKFVRDLTRSSERVWVMTGPLWMPTLGEDGKWHMKHELIGKPPALVSVPTHYYKVVLAKGLQSKGRQQPAPDGGGGVVPQEDLGVAAFVMPNAPIDPATPLSAFVVPLEPLESVAGTRFFPSFLSRERLAGLDWQAQNVRTAALSGMKVFDRQALVDSVPQQLTNKGTAGPLLLESASSANLAAAAPAAGLARATSAPGALVQPPPPPPKGCRHLCELVACRLPAERFWEKGGGGGGGEGGGRSSGSRGGSRQQQLTRR